MLSKTNEAAEAAASTAILVFPLYYLAMVLAMTAATVLTIQQFSESIRYQHQFALLRKLGMDRQDMGVLVGSSHPAMISLITLGLFFLIYAVYILMSYISIKRRVLPAKV